MKNITRRGPVGRPNVNPMLLCDTPETTTIDYFLLQPVRKSAMSRNHDASPGTYNHEKSAMNIKL